MTTILERVTKVTASRLGAKEDAVIPSASFTDDLGADSLDLVELIMGLEEEFSTPDKPVKIPDEDAAKIKTVQDAVDYLKSKGISDAASKPQATQTTTQGVSAALKTANKATPVVSPQKKAITSLETKPATKSTRTVKKTKTT